MINLYTGTPGSGKSLHLVSLLLFDFKHNHNNLKVVTNVCFDLSPYAPEGAVTVKDVFDLDPSWLCDFALTHCAGSRPAPNEFLLIIDESQQIFGSREWRSVNRRAWLDFFSVHRHFGFNVILVAQSPKMLDCQIRGICETDTIHFQPAHIAKFLDLLTFGGAVPLFLWAQRYSNNHRLVLSRGIILGRKSLFSRYDSMSLDFLGSLKVSAPLSPAHELNDPLKSSGRSTTPIACGENNTARGKIYHL